MRRTGAALVLAAAVVVAIGAQAQPGRRPPGAPPAPSASVAPAGTLAKNVRAHVGTDYAQHLLRSSDPEDRVRAVQRLGAIGSAEAVAMLVSAAESNQTLRADSRALVEMARALAKFTDNERARSALMLIVNVGNPGVAGRLPVPGRSADALALEEGDPVARAELARETAAIALARSGVDRALEQLYGAARGGGSGQAAAMLALTLAPPRDPGFFGTTGVTMPPAVIRMLGQLGDLRALDVLHAASKSTDINVRGAALLALAELGDERAVPLARTAIAEPDARLRGAAAETLVILGAPEKYKAVVALMADDATVTIAIHLAERVYHAEITKLLAARAQQDSGADRELRLAAIRALGRSPDPNAATALVSTKILADRALAYPAMLALARSPAPNATQLCAAVAAGNLKTLGVRAYVVRSLLRRERSDQAEAVVTQLLSSREPRERAIAVFAEVALGRAAAEDFLDDKEPRVRRAAAMGTLARPTRDVQRLLLARRSKEADELTRQVLGIGLLSGDPDGSVTTTELVDRAESGGADAALSAFALARRADDPLARRIGLLLGSKDALLRAHAARGLALAPLADASGRLADAYAYETDVDVRRALVSALALRTRDASAPARRITLELAASLDPDGPVRQAARRALDGAGAPAPFGTPPVVETAWLRLTLDGGAAPGDSYAATIVRADGTAVPIVFDDEGYAIVAGVPPGDARLVLAPRLPPSKSPSAP
jgi:HEAT repeat protein